MLCLALPPPLLIQQERLTTQAVEEGRAAIHVLVIALHEVGVAARRASVTARLPADYLLGTEFGVIGTRFHNEHVCRMSLHSAVITLCPQVLALTLVQRLAAAQIPPLGLGVSPDPVTTPERLDLACELVLLRFEHVRSHHAQHITRQEREQAGLVLAIDSVVDESHRFHRTCLQYVASACPFLPQLFVVDFVRQPPANQPPVLASSDVVTDLHDGVCPDGALVAQEELDIARDFGSGFFDCAVAVDAGQTFKDA